MQQWLYVIPIVGTLLSLTADIISLATTLIVRRDAARAREPIPSHLRTQESANGAEHAHVTVDCCHPGGRDLHCPRGTRGPLAQVLGMIGPRELR